MVNHMQVLFVYGHDDCVCVFVFCFFLLFVLWEPFGHVMRSGYWIISRLPLRPLTLSQAIEDRDRGKIRLIVPENPSNATHTHMAHNYVFVWNGCDHDTHPALPNGYYLKEQGKKLVFKIKCMPRLWAEVIPNAPRHFYFDYVFLFFFFSCLYLCHWSVIYVFLVWWLALFIFCLKKIVRTNNSHSAKEQWKCCGSQTQTIYFQTKPTERKHIQKHIHGIYLLSVYRTHTHKHHTEWRKKNKRPINREICFRIHDLKTIFIFVSSVLIGSVDQNPGYRYTLAWYYFHWPKNDANVVE